MYYPTSANPFRCRSLQVFTKRNPIIRILTSYISLSLSLYIYKIYLRPPGGFFSAEATYNSTSSRETSATRRFKVVRVTRSLALSVLPGVALLVFHYGRSPRVLSAFLACALPDVCCIDGAPTYFVVEVSAINQIENERNIWKADDLTRQVHGRPTTRQCLWPLLYLKYGLSIGLP